MKAYGTDQKQMANAYLSIAPRVQYEPLCAYNPEFCECLSVTFISKRDTWKFQETVFTTDIAEHSLHKMYTVCIQRVYPQRTTANYQIYTNEGSYTHQHAGSGGRRQGLNSKENQTERTKYGILGSVTTIPLINNRYRNISTGRGNIWFVQDFLVNWRRLWLPIIIYLCHQ